VKREKLKAGLYFSLFSFRFSLFIKINRKSKGFSAPHEFAFGNAWLTSAHISKPVIMCVYKATGFVSVMVF